jgi:diguanylate cyclase (GGDEF)-like protein
MLRTRAGLPSTGLMSSPVASLYATHDDLTGLANRSLFQRHLDDAAGSAVGFALLFLDIDNFKAVNDAFGHGVGDALLSAVGERLQEALRDGDAVGRLGGDEFAVLCRGMSSADEAAALADRLRLRLRVPFAVAGRELHVTASIGCRAVCPSDRGSGEALLGDADAAMYQAKEAGRDRVEIFSAETRARVVRRLELADELRRALSRDELALHLQPHVDLASHAIVGAEALLRWTHPRLGQVSPGEFIPVAEQFGLIVPIGAWVLEQAVAQLARWQAAGRRLTLSVNVSAAQLGDSGFAEHVERIVRGAGVAPERLCLELTESTLMTSSGPAIAALRGLRDLGHYIAIDDFGTGYSSLAYLTDLPVEILKIDRQFVAGVAEHGTHAAVVASIMSLAHAMGLHVVAEGIEEPEQARELLALGCLVGQGFHFARPLPAAEFDALWRRGIDAAGHARGHGESRSVPRRDIVDEMMHQIGIPEADL